MDLNTLLVIGLAATVALWVVTLVRHPEMRGLAVSGARNAVVAAIVVATVMLVLTTLFFNGRDFFGTISLVSAFSFGIVVGGIVGAAFFWLNIVILAIGLWVEAGRGWAIGALVATPIVIAAVGFGFTAYNAYQYQQAQPQTVAGQVTLELSGQRLGDVSASDSVSCQLWDDGGLSIDAAIAADDGRQADIQFGLTTDDLLASLAVAVGDLQALPGKGWDPGPNTTRLVDGWSRQSGEVVLTNLVPLGTDGEPDPIERWSGSLSWSCPQPS